MAYTMTHIFIAEKLFDRFQKKIDYATYILGATAPDAVHVLENYTPKLKERSHLFPPGLRWGEVSKGEDDRNWLASIKRYYLENRQSDSTGFLEGYIVHLLSDVYCAVHFFEPFVKSITSEREKIMAQLKEESYGVNYYFYELFSKQDDLYQILKEGKAETLEHVIEKETIERRTDQLFEFEFKPRDISKIADYEICRIEDMERIINEACEFILQVVSDDGYVDFFYN